jgi:glycosyltransferase involved in cell wall biosynthesis
MFKKINPRMKEPGIVCFGGLDWWYHNRGHIDFQLMKRFSKSADVLYINSIVMQKPKLSQPKTFLKKLIRKSKSISRGLQKVDTGFYVYSPVSLPLHHISLTKKMNELIVGLQISRACSGLNIRSPLVWVACPAACNIAINMKKSMLIYQRTDKFEEFPNIDSSVIKKYDLLLKQHANVTFFVNEKLYNAESTQCRNAVLIDHGVDFEKFAFAEKIDYMPREIKDLQKPIVGFFGGIDSHTFDIDFVDKLTDLMKNVSFVFIGKYSLDCSRLLSKPNVLMLGQKPYEQIPHYGKHFDVAIMPWNQNRWIDSCNPIKLKEYLALGKPIVSTPFSELDKYSDVVYVSDNPLEFSQLIYKALAENSSRLIEARKSKVRSCTWDNQAAMILNMLTHDSQNNIPKGDLCLTQKN